MPNAEFPNLSKLLPGMASVEDQNLWTGTNGFPLLKQSVSFIHVVGCEYHRLTGRGLNDQRMLDYGSGWGRFLRLMARYTAPDNIWGVDPWDRSIDVCTENRVWGHYNQSQYLPETLPVEGTFDLAYAYSVFTHTSEPATRTALAAIRKAMRPDGVLAMTIRPIEYWDLATQFIETLPIERLKASHRDTGLAFEPHMAEPGVEQHYGDTSMTLDWLAEAAQGWKIVSHEVSIEDPYQLVVFLRPA
jgi:2-polyprenyl-3-methyl-5-hydroxy-6-metoxy-1,4-benzoquinol methylase